jgi:hypothetical protein
VAHNEDDLPDFLKEIADKDHSSPYPEGALERMSDKQLKRERLKQISDGDNADLDDPLYDLSLSKLTYVLIELDRRGVKYSA